jgi:hypothetical protein
MLANSLVCTNQKRQKISLGRKAQRSCKFTSSSQTQGVWKFGSCMYLVSYDEKKF